MKPAEIKLYLLYTYLKIYSDDQNFIIAPNLCRIDFLSKQQMWTFQELRNLLPQNWYTGPIRKLYISPDSTSKVQNLTQCLLLIGQYRRNYAIRLCIWRTKMAGSALRASWEIFSCECTQRQVDWERRPLSEIQHGGKQCGGFSALISTERSFLIYTKLDSR